MDTITGFVGLVVQPDAETIRATYALAAALMPDAAEQVVAPGSLPHVTLTQCAVRAAPRARIAELVTRLESDLRGVRVTLDAVVASGAGFLFWCAGAGPARKALRHAHEHALTLAEGWLDPVANAAVVEATRRAFAGDRALVDNAQRYGYALVHERYAPHITLGFDPRLAGEPPIEASRPHTMTVDRVVLARLGRYGRVEAVLSVE